MKKLLSVLTAIALCALCVFTLASCGSKEDIAVVKFMSHTSLNQIEESIVSEIKAEDSSLKVKCYNTNGKMDQISQTLTSIKKRGVKTVVCIATPVAATAKGIFTGKKAGNTNIIFAAVSDPVSSDIVSNLKAPEGNITGTSDAVDLDKQIELAKLVNPSLKKIGYIYSASEDNSVANKNRLQVIAAEKDLTLVDKPLSNVNDISSVFDSMKSNIDALIVTDDNQVASTMGTLSTLCIEAKIPCYCAADSEIKDGGMMGYSINYVTLGVDTAKMAVKAHKGTPIKEIPVKVYQSSELALYYNSTFISNSKISIPEGLLTGATDLA